MTTNHSSADGNASLIGQHIGNFRLVRLLGEGGMGVVFQAVQVNTGGPAAVKILRPEVAVRHDITQRFFNEAKAAASISHPAIVRVFDSGYTPSGIAYLAMEFLEGESLRDRLKQVGKLSVSEALRVARQMASALRAAHQQGVIHRDLKPDNVMLVPDPDLPGGERAKLLDFGIAKMADSGSGRKTRSGMIMGTPTYMAPEQCHGAKLVTDKSDVYALGVILYEMLGGRPPFVGEGFGELAVMHIADPPPSLLDFAPYIDPTVAAVVHSLLAKQQSHRPSMEEALSAFVRLMNAIASSSTLRFPVPEDPAQIDTRRDSGGRQKPIGPLALSVVHALANHDLAGLEPMMRSHPDAPTVREPALVAPSPAATVPIQQVRKRTLTDAASEVQNPSPPVAPRRWLTAGVGILGAALVVGVWSQAASRSPRQPASQHVPQYNRAVAPAPKKVDGSPLDRMADTPVALLNQSIIPAHKPSNAVSPIAPSPKEVSSQMAPTLQVRLADPQTPAPVPPHPALASALAAWNRGQYEKAAQQALECGNARPKSTRCWWLLGMAACQMKDYAQIALAHARLNELSKPLVAEIEDACFGNGITRHLDGTFGSLRMVEPTGP